MGILTNEVSTNQQALHKEMEHIGKALQACSFPPCTPNNLHNKCNCKHNIHNGQNSTDNKHEKNSNSGTNSKKNISIMVPYIHGLGRGLKGHATAGGPGTFQGYQHLKNPSYGPQGKGKQITKEWSHLQI